MPAIPSFISLLLTASALSTSIATTTFPPNRPPSASPDICVPPLLGNATLNCRTPEDSKPNPLTDGLVCPRNAECAKNAAVYECAMPPYMRRPKCLPNRRTRPSASLCCGKTHPEDHPCTIFWPKSNAECAEDMKHHDCHRAFGAELVCDPIKTHEPPDQCALKAHCAGKTFEKRCRKWYHRVIRKACGHKPDYGYCCLPLWRGKPLSMDSRLNRDCTQNWPKNFDECKKGCKAEIGGRVTCDKEKRDLSISKTTPLPPIITKLPLHPFHQPGVSKDSPHGQEYYRNSCAFFSLCAHLRWQDRCNQHPSQKLKPWCWSDAPQVKECCDAQHRLVSDHCSRHMDRLATQCEERMSRWRCHSEKRGFICKLADP